MSMSLIPGAVAARSIKRPYELRRYIHDLASRVGTTHDLRTIVMLSAGSEEYLPIRVFLRRRNPHRHAVKRILTVLSCPARKDIYIARLTPPSALPPASDQLNAGRHYHPYRSRSIQS
jgi:hypothetical protein